METPMENQRVPENLSEKNNFTHDIRIHSQGFLKQLIPPFLFGAALWGMIKTDAQHKEINYSVVAFTGLCIFNNIFGW
jgi:hypothetical protein